MKRMSLLSLLCVVAISPVAGCSDSSAPAAGGQMMNDGAMKGDAMMKDDMKSGGMMQGDGMMKEGMMKEDSK